MQTAEHTHPHSDKTLLEPPRPTVGILDWLLYIPFFALFFSSLVLMDIAMRIGLIFGIKPFEKCVATLNHIILKLLRIVGTQIIVEYEGELPTHGPCLIVSNHQSLFDIPIIHSIFEHLRPKYISKIELGRGKPGVSFNLRHPTNALINRTDSEQSLNEIIRLGNKMKAEGFSVVLFPEGTRARRGVLKKFRSRGFATLHEITPEASIIPITIDGSWKLASYSIGPIPIRTTVKVKVGTPIQNAENTPPKKLLDGIHKKMESHLQKMRR